CSQAEDGIRDRNVTGVQTCALPILTNEYAGPAKPTENSTALSELFVTVAGCWRSLQTRSAPSARNSKPSPKRIQRIGSCHLQRSSKKVFPPRMTRRRSSIET